MKPTPRRATAGFSLMELLLVMGVVVVLASLAAPVTVRVIQSSRLSGSGDMLTNKLSQYQQEAIASNEPIEVRLYKFNDPNDVSGQAYFRAVQFYHDAPSTANPNTAVPTALDRPFFFDSGTCINPSATLSTICTLTETTPVSGQDSFPSTYTNVRYVSFKFLPDGSTTLDPTSGKLWYMTVVQDRQAGLTAVGTATNQINDYITVQIDPYTGRTRTFRP